ncbi:MAG: TolC family protein [Bacteroidetes bacterium]|nr:TolC family protein [Bacteroidota bacterium]MBS1539533.1 TolC family protein [Bacteroidota bacterium]
MTYRIIFILFICTSQYCFSQENKETQLIDLKSALSIAHDNYPSIRRKLAEKEAAHYAESATKTNYLPSVILQSQIVNGTSNQVRGPFFPNEGMAIPISAGLKTNGYTATSTWGSYATGFVRWNVYNFGKVKASVDVAKAGSVSAQADYDNEVFQQQIKVGDAYLIALTAKNIANSQRVNLDRVGKLKEVITAYAKSGLKAGVDSSLVKAEYAKALLLYLESKRTATDQVIFLKEEMGLKVDQSILLDTINYNTRLPNAIQTNSDYSNNPRLLYLKSIVDVNQAKVKEIGKRELPAISLLGASWTRGSGIQDKTAPNGDFIYNTSFSSGVAFRPFLDWFVGVSTIWNITNSYRNSREAKAQRQVTAMAQEQYNEETLKTEGEVERARVRYNVALEVARQAPVQLEAAQDAYLQAQARYNAGMATILELTQTFTVLNRAEVDLAIAQGNVWRAVNLYAAATGNLDVFTSNLK